VAGVNVWGDVASQVGGALVSVTSVLDDPNKDPHEYQANVANAAAIAHAALIIVNGAGYDDFMSRLLAASGRGRAAVLTVASVVGVTGSDPNPHFWYSPAYAGEVATAIEARLVQLRPSAAATFRANLAAVLAGEATVTDVLTSIRSRYAGVGVAYTERVPGYLLADAGLRVVSPSSFARAIENGDDPSPLAAASFDAVLARHEARALLYNSQVTDPATGDLETRARHDGVPIVGVGETLPAGEHLYTWQAAQARALLAALGG